MIAAATAEIGSSPSRSGSFEAALTDVVGVDAVVDLVVFMHDDLVQLHVLHAELETDPQVRGPEQDDKVTERLPEQSVRGQRRKTCYWRL